jgi:hypothetical protein
MAMILFTRIILVGEPFFPTQVSILNHGWYRVQSWSMKVFHATMYISFYISILLNLIN